MEEINKNFNSLLMFLVVILLNITLFFSSQKYHKLQQEAVDRGFAEWQLIEGSKETYFKWKE